MSQRPKTLFGSDYQQDIRRIFNDIAWPIAVRVTTNPDWVREIAAYGLGTQDALCAQTDPDLFFPDAETDGLSLYEEKLKGARVICVRCPVLERCIETSLALSPEDGVYGGMTPRNRNALLVSAAMFAGDIAPPPLPEPQAHEIATEEAA